MGLSEHAWLHDGMFIVRSAVLMLITSKVLYSMSAFAKSIGLTTSQSNTVTAILNLGTAVGRPCIGTLSDRYGRIEVAGLSTVACAISIFALWMPASSFGLTIVFCLISGAVIGNFWMVNLNSKPANYHSQD